MPYKSAAQRKFMHAKLPQIAQRWDAEIRSKRAPKVNKVYRTGSPVAHKNMTLDPTGYVNREVNKGKRTQRKRSGIMLERAAQRRAIMSSRQPKRLGM